MTAGALWNSDVVDAEPRALRNLIAEAVPPLAQVMAAVDVRIGTPWESEAARSLRANASRRPVT